MHGRPCNVIEFRMFFVGDVLFANTHYHLTFVVTAFPLTSMFC